MVKKILLFLILLLGSTVLARTSKHSTSNYYSNHANSYKYSSSTKRAYGVARDNHGHIKRSSRMRHQFMKSHPCPSTGKGSGPCPGYIVDHVKPLKRGGPDNPSNMQWQTTEAAKAKDKVE
jgi:hypothetical protein